MKLKLDGNLIIIGNRKFKILYILGADIDYISKTLISKYKSYYVYTNSIYEFNEISKVLKKYPEIKFKKDNSKKYQNHNQSPLYFDPIYTKLNFMTDLISLNPVCGIIEFKKMAKLEELCKELEDLNYKLVYKYKGRVLLA